ncbi:MAG: hypothetical protein WA160_15060 [Pseudobdellovibrio sp.]
MKNLFLVAATFLFALTIYAHADGPGVTSAKVLELSAHRIDRLVSLSKIDSSFLKKIEKVDVSILVDSAPAYYKVLVSQTQPSFGSPFQLEIIFDDDGKPLSFHVLDGGVAGPDQNWPDKDSDSLVENALHYILENNADSKVTLFDKGVSSFVLSKVNLNNEIVAMGQATSSLTADKLNIYLKLNGTFISAEIIP